MGDALIEQFCGAYHLSNMEFLRRCQREFRDRVQPMLDERERLLVDVDVLKKQVEILTDENDRLRKRKGAA